MKIVRGTSLLGSDKYVVNRRFPEKDVHEFVAMFHLYAIGGSNGKQSSISESRSEANA